MGNDIQIAKKKSVGNNEAKESFSRHSYKETTLSQKIARKLTELECPNQSSSLCNISYVVSQAQYSLVN